MIQETCELSVNGALALGTTFALAGNHESAIGLFRGVLVHEPDNFEAIERLGSSLFERRQYYEALYWFWRGRKIDRCNPLALTNYALCVAQLGHPHEATPNLERAAELAEKTDCTAAVRALVYNNLGNTLERLGRHAEALATLDRAVAFDPSDPLPHFNRGIALLRLNRHREAIAALDTSLRLRAPRQNTTSRLDEADVRYNRGMAYLLLGEFKQGFSDYEFRLLTSENKVPNLGLDPGLKWQLGESVSGKTVLVHCEQGLGDTIQFLRFLPILAALATKEILLIAHAVLRPLIEIPGVSVREPGSEITGKFDCWVALMSLPLYLGVDETTVPLPWVPPPGADIGRLGPAGCSGLNVGVCWAGNFQHKNDAHRSIPLNIFATVFGAAGCNYLSLQQLRPGETLEFAELKKHHPNLAAPHLTDLRDTVAAIRGLDLVISVDTAAAHLSASIGLPTWILIPNFSTDWRWMLKRADSPWYPSATLYRQSQMGNWRATLNEVRRDLSALAARRALNGPISAAT